MKNTKTVAVVTIDDLNREDKEIIGMFDTFEEAIRQLKKHPELIAEERYFDENWREAGYETSNGCFIDVQEYIFPWFRLGLEA